MTNTSSAELGISPGPEIAKTAEDFVADIYKSTDRIPHTSVQVSTSEQLPSRNKTQYDVRLLREIFPPKESESSYMLGITAIHGNEPQLITTSVAAEINDILREHGLNRARIVIPAIYGERTKKILKEEYPVISDNIFLSEELGQILKKTEFSRAGYQAHMREVAAHQPQAYEELLQFLSRPFLATSLTGEVKEFEPRGRRLEINAGANVTASEQAQPKTHFIFPVLLSEMIGSVLKDQEISPYFDPAILETVLKHAKNFEAQYRTTQIPYIHTLAFQPDYSAKGKILTPPLKKLKTAPHQEINPGKSGVYIMASGSEIGKEPLEDQAREISKQGYDVLYPEWLQFDFGRAAIPDVIYHPNVKAVMGRMGWGIGWISQVAEKPFIAMPHLWFDNPEIHFNLKTIEQSGLGIVFQARSDIIEQAMRLTPKIHEVNERIIRELNVPRNKDGIRFAAEKIVEAEIEDVGKRV